MTRLDRCVCGGPHGWRCAWGIFRDVQHRRVLSKWYGFLLSITLRALAERQQMKRELYRLQGGSK